MTILLNRFSSRLTGMLLTCLVYNPTSSLNSQPWFSLGSQYNKDLLTLKTTAGPTTQPKNLLTYGKLRGTVKPVHDSSHPPFAADFVDGGAWIQLEALASGETWAKGNISVLLK